MCKLIFACSLMCYLKTFITYLLGFTVYLPKNMGSRVTLSTQIDEFTSPETIYHQGVSSRGRKKPEFIRDRAGNLATHSFAIYPAQFELTSI